MCVAKDKSMHGKYMVLLLYSKGNGFNFYNFSKIYNFHNIPKIINFPTLR